MKKLALDLGGSQLRVGSRKDRILVVDSPIMEIDPSVPVKDYLEDKLCDFVIRTSTYRDLEERRFVRDEGIAQYQGEMMVINNQDVKVLQEAAYINAIFGIAGKLMLEGESLTDDSKIGVCIPTSEYYSDEQDYAQMFKSKIVGQHSVYFPLCDKTIVFEIASAENVAVMPEGVVAAFTFANEPKFVNGITLIIDAGYRSTDITVLRKFSPVGKSAVSRPIGGTNIEAMVLNSLERKNIMLTRDALKESMQTRYIIVDNELLDITLYCEDGGYVAADITAAMVEDGFDVSEEDIEVALDRYYIKRGDEFEDISTDVFDAMRTFLTTLKADIIDVLSAAMLNISSVNNILPIGRIFTSKTAVAILEEVLNCPAKYFAVPDTGNANVVGMLGVLN